MRRTMPLHVLIFLLSVSGLILLCSFKTHVSYVILKPDYLTVASQELPSTNNVMMTNQEQVSYHLESLKKLGFFTHENTNLLLKIPNKPKPTMRKLSFIIPPLPTPLTPSPNTISPTQNFPFAEGPLPPLVGPISSPPSPFPLLSPAHSPHHPHHLPPCNPWAGPSAPRASPSPVAGEKLWCVAKPSVPAMTLQEAVDYACGEGAECNEIQPNGNCYFPDSLVAHASFAFNSYWQKNKKDGGTCDFGGTAMLINSDPSFLQCRFPVN